MKDHQPIVTRCPACGHQTLFVGSGGYLTCSWLKCSNPDYDDARIKKERALKREAAKLAFFEGVRAAIVNPDIAWEQSEVRKAIDGVMTFSKERDGDAA